MPIRLQVGSITRPSAASDEDIAQIERDMQQQSERELIGYDVRFTKFLGYVALLCLALMSAAITWSAATLVGLKSDVAVLLARPEGVSKQQYERDAQRWDSEIEAINRRHEREER